MDTSFDPDSYRSGFIAVMGQTNVGKSSLLNALVEHTIAAVSPRPQTTRKRQYGIVSLENAQIILEDTPGLHKPRTKLGDCMNQEALEALDDTDAILFLVDASQEPSEEEHELARSLQAARQQHGLPVLLVLNKCDLVDEQTLAERIQAYQALAPGADTLVISVQEQKNLAELLEKLVSYLPVHPPYFPDEPLTDLYERDIAADLIRAAALLHLRDEIPHGIAIRIDQYTERGEQGAYIEGTIFVERESQKGIVIGKGGMMLKQIGSTARQEIEAMSGRSIFVRLRVKVRQNWRNDPESLKLFGFKIPQDK